MEELFVWLCDDSRFLNYLIFDVIYSGTDEDLEYYVRECGDILAVTTKLPLYYTFLMLFIQVQMKI